MYRLAWLSVWLDNYPKGRFMVHHESKLSLVVEVKSNQYLDPQLMDLEELVLIKLIHLFSQGGWGA